jgi:hypothetical protein
MNGSACHRRLLVAGTEKDPDHPPRGAARRRVVGNWTNSCIFRSRRANSAWITLTGAVAGFKRSIAAVRLCFVGCEGSEARPYQRPRRDGRDFAVVPATPSSSAIADGSGSHRSRTLRSYWRGSTAATAAPPWHLIKRRALARRRQCTKLQTKGTPHPDGGCLQRASHCARAFSSSTMTQKAAKHWGLFWHKRG